MATPSVRQQNYAEKLKDPRWQRKRLEVLDRDKFRCRWCWGDTEELHVHHLWYYGEPWEVSSELLETLCRTCHEKRPEMDKELAGLIRHFPSPDLKVIQDLIETIRYVFDDNVCPATTVIAKCWAAGLYDYVKKMHPEWLPGWFKPATWEFENEPEYYI